MIRNLSSRQWQQIGIVHGAIGECGDIDYPTIFIRLDHPLVLDFITSIVEGKILSSARISPPMVFLKSKNSIALLNNNVVGVTKSSLKARHLPWNILCSMYSNDLLCICTVC